MRHTPLTLAAITVLAIAALTACESDVDGTSIVPHFSAITCNPQHPQPGDSITLTATQDQLGHLINATTYTWELTYTKVDMQDTTVTLQRHVVYDAEGGNADPQIGFNIPAETPGRYLRVNLNATYNLSGQDKNGSIYGSATRSTVINLQ